LQRQLKEERERTISKRFGQQRQNQRNDNGYVKKVFHDKSNKPPAGEFGKDKNGQVRPIIWCDKHSSWGCHATSDCKGIPLRGSGTKAATTDSSVMVVDYSPYSYSEEDETNHAFVA